MHHISTTPTMPPLVLQQIVIVELCQKSSQQHFIRHQKSLPAGGEELLKGDAVIALRI